jgi:acetoin utilization protein AcuB
MKIKHYMTPDPITVAPDTPILDAKKIMKDYKIRRLPVVDRGKLVGMVTYRNIIEASPSAASALSAHELNYLITKLTVRDVMRRNPISVSPADSVVDVIMQGARRGIGSFPVVENDQLVGIVTESEITNAVLQIFGTGTASSLIELEQIGSEESVGDFKKIAEVLEEIHVPVLGIWAMPQRDTGDQHILIRVKTTNTEPVAARLVQAGYKLAD